MYVQRMSGRLAAWQQASSHTRNAGEELVAFKKQSAAFESQEQMEAPSYYW